MVTTRHRKMQKPKVRLWANFFVVLTCSMLTAPLITQQAYVPICPEFSGLPFHRKNALSQAWNSPESMAGEVTLFDCNPDCQPDIFFTNCAELEAPTEASSECFKRSLGKAGEGEFTQVTAQGLLDLFVVNDLQPSYTDFSFCRDQCHPRRYQGTPDQPVIKQDQGSASAGRGVLEDVGKSMGVASFNADANLPFHNLGDSFQELGLQTDVAKLPYAQVWRVSWCG